MLKKQLMDISLAQGIETQVDEKVLSSKNLVVENATFNKFQALQKCKGYAAIGHDIAGGGSLSGKVKNIFKLGKQLMAVSDDRKFYSYYRPGENWREMDGVKFPAKLESFDLNYNGATQNNPDMAYNATNNISATVYEEFDLADRVISIALRDHTTNKVITSSVGIGSYPRVNIVESGGVIKIFVFWMGGLKAKLRVYDLELNTVTAIKDLSSATASSAPISTNQVGNTILFMYPKASSSGLIVGDIDYSETINTIDFAPTNSYNSAGAYGLSCKIFDGNYWLAWIDDADQVVTKAYQSDLATVEAGETIVQEFVWPLKVDFTKNGNDLHYFVETKNTGPFISGADFRSIQIEKRTFSGGSFSGTDRWLSNNCALQSEIYYDSINSKFYALLAFDSDLQKTNFFCEIELTTLEGEDVGYPHVMAKTTKGLGIGYHEFYAPTKLTFDSNLFYMAAEKTRKYVANETTLYDSSAIEHLTIDMDNFSLQYNEVGKSVLLASGVVLESAGLEVLENGFFLNPETFKVEELGTSGNIGAGTRGYKILFEYYNSKGELSRSAPSQSISITQTGASKKNELTFIVPIFGQKTHSRCKTTIYRTKDSGTVYYKLNQYEERGADDPFDSFYQYTDNLSDASIDSNEILYTEGGEIESDSAPQADAIFSSGKRAFLAGLKISNEFAYSKISEFEVSPSFSDFYRIAIDSVGKVNAGAFIDDKVILFKDRSTYYMVGGGPNNNGQNDNFSRPEVISSDVGCVEKQSILNLPDGILFKSAKGFYFLDRSLNAQYIGNSVHSFDDIEVKASILVEEANEARFYLASGHTLVFHYLLQEWDVFTYPASGAVNIDGVVKFLQDGIIYKEDSSFTYNGEFYSLKVKTPWLKLNTMQGFQRIWRAIVTGEYKSPHTLTMRIYFDYDSSTYEDHTITVDSPGPYSLMAHIGKQKCSAIMFEIFDNPTSGGESMELTTLTLEVGLKKGASKLASGKRF